MANADIRIRVLLDDMARMGLYGINTELGRMRSLTRLAGAGFGEMNVMALGGVLGLGAAFVGLGLILKSSIEDAMQYQTLQIRMARATNATSAETDELGKTLLKVGGDSIFSLEQIADGFVLLGQKGISARDIIDGVGVSGIKLAEAIGVEPVDAMGLLGTAMANLGIPARDSQKAMALLQYAFEHGLPSVAMLTQAFAQVGGTAKLAHVPMDELVVLMGILGRALGSGSSAGTTLAYIFRTMMKPATDKAKEALEKLGVSAYDAAGRLKDPVQFLHELNDHLKGLSEHARNDILGTIFNVRSGKGIALLLSQLDEVDKRLQWLHKHQDNVTNALERARKVEESAAGTWSALKTNITDVLILLGTPFLSVLQPVLNFLKNVSISLRNWMSEGDHAAVAAKVLGGAFIVLGIAAAVFVGVMFPFIAIAAAIVAVVALLAVGIIFLVTHWNALMKTISQWPIFITLKGLFNDLVNMLRAILTPAINLLVNVWNNNLKPALLGLWHVLQPLLPILKWIAIAIGAVLVGAILVAILAIGLIVAAILVVAAIMAWLASKVIGALVTAFNWLKDKVVGVWNTIVNTFNSVVHGGLQSVWAKIWGWLSSLPGLMAQLGLNLLKSLATGIFNGITNFLSSAIHSVTSFISDHLPHSPAKLGPLRDLELQGRLIPATIAQGMMTGSNKVVSAAGYMAGSTIPGVGGGRGGLPMTLVLKLDSKVLGEANLEYIRGLLQLNGMARMLR